MSEAPQGGEQMLSDEQIEELRNRLPHFVAQLCELESSKEHWRERIDRLCNQAKLYTALLAQGAELPEPHSFDSDGYRAETGVKPKFVLKDDYDRLRAVALRLAQSRADVIEECARVCESHVGISMLCDTPAVEQFYAACNKCAAAIRALSPPVTPDRAEEPG